MTLYKSASRGKPVNLQDALTTTGNGTAIAIPSSFTQHKVTIIGSAGISAGAVQIESADTPAYAGTWSPVVAAITAVASKEIEYNWSGLLSAVRARISTNIVDGTVTVKYQGS